MEIREPVCCQVALDGGILTGATGRYTKKFGDLVGLYADCATYDLLARSRADEIVYEVTEFRPNDTPGDLIFGIDHDSASGTERPLAGPRRGASAFREEPRPAVQLRPDDKG